MLGRVVAIGALGQVLLSWGSTAGRSGGVDHGFLIWPGRLLFATLQATYSPSSDLAADGEIWSRCEAFFPVASCCCCW